MRNSLGAVGVLVLSTLLVQGACLHASELGFSRYYTDNMVLQRDQPALIRGSAPANAAVTVSFAGQSKTAAADADGQWAVTLEPMPASAEPRNLAVCAADKTVTLKNILAGDVILFARQTSIDITLARDEAGRKAAAAHKSNPLFRAMRLQTIPSARPQQDLSAEATSAWAVVDPDSALRMSAAAYYFGRDLAHEVGVPVGLIDLNLGSAFPISWLSRAALEETTKFYGKNDVPGLLKRFDEAIELAGKAELRKKDNLPATITDYALFPAGGYNAVLNPLKGLALKTAIVQLGNDYPYMPYAQLEKEGKPFDREELNNAYVRTYDIRKVGFRMEPVTIPRIPREWRKVFADDKLPIGLVLPSGSALHTYALHNREMRELLRITAGDHAGVGIILPGSENVPQSGQPADEALLAERTRRWVLGTVYQKEPVATGPLFEKLDTQMNEATVHFKAGTAQGLKANKGALDLFEVAGTEGAYAPAKATIDGDVIRLKCAQVNRIRNVRYNWAERPGQGLVNAAGLPAIPFRSERAEYAWFLTNEDNDLPVEYYTPANEWKANDVTLVNGQMKTHGYDNFSGWVGPAGFMTGPFGPNMGVREVKAGSPAAGKILAGDVIYSVNGKMLGERAWEVMGAAITESETAEKGGRLQLGVHRAGHNLDVELTLKVMGTFSSTAPYDCPKTEQIITDLEQWVVAHGAGEGFLNTDALFLMATGNTKLQGYVRRIIYSKMANMNLAQAIDPKNAGKSWFNSADALLFGEYYLSTGDRNVLPYLKNFCDRLAASQNKQEGGWRHNFPGGPTYGLIPNAGLPGVMGMNLAQKAGVNIDLVSYELGLNHFGHNRAETGFLIYGFGGCEREVPAPFDPEAMATGHMNSYNGGLSAAGILMGLAGNYRAAHLCSFISAYAWNNTFHGHGGNFWNNFWTPLGANAHSKAAFIHFWQEYRWYRELNRMFDGSLIQHQGGEVGAGTGVALVAPRQRLQIVGAPLSPFATNAPVILMPALEAFAKKDYAGCEKQANELLATGLVSKNDRPTVEYLARASREIPESIDVDLGRVEKLLKDGKFDEANLDVDQLKGVLPAGNERLVAFEKALAAPGVATKIKNNKGRTAEHPEELVSVENTSSDEFDSVTSANGKSAQKRDWACLVTEISTARSKSGTGKVPPAQASKWRMAVVEDMSQAPDGWTSPDFNDRDWAETNLPMSWKMYHTALLRTKFMVKDKQSFDALRFRSWLYRQQGVEIYLNGKLIARVNNLEEKTATVEAELNEAALQQLQEGENTLTIATRHNWRWGMLAMYVYNDGFGFMLDAQKRLAH